MSEPRPSRRPWHEMWAADRGLDALPWRAIEAKPEDPRRGRRAWLSATALGLPVTFAVAAFSAQSPQRNGVILLVLVLSVVILLGGGAALFALVYARAPTTLRRVSFAAAKSIAMATLTFTLGVGAGTAFEARELAALETGLAQVLATEADAFPIIVESPHDSELPLVCARARDAAPIRTRGVIARVDGGSGRLTVHPAQRALASERLAAQPDEVGWVALVSTHERADYWQWGDGRTADSELTVVELYRWPSRDALGAVLLQKVPARANETSGTHHIDYGDLVDGVDAVLVGRRCRIEAVADQGSSL